MELVKLGVSPNGGIPNGGSLIGVSLNPVNDTVNDTIALRIYHTQLKIV